MTSSEQSWPDPADICSGPRDRPFRGFAAHRWLPLALYGMPGDAMAQVPADEARVIEVCPSCQQWRQRAYTRIDPSPGIRG